MNEKVAKKVNELRTMEVRAQYIERQLETINANINEFEIAKAALSEINNSNELLVPIGAGISLKMKIVEKEKALVRLGAGVVVEKNIDELAKEIETKKEEFVKLSERAQNELEKIINNINTLQSEVGEMEEQSG